MEAGQDTRADSADKLTETVLQSLKMPQNKCLCTGAGGRGSNRACTGLFEGTFQLFGDFRVEGLMDGGVNGVVTLTCCA